MNFKAKYKGREVYFEASYSCLYEPETVVTILIDSSTGSITLEDVSISSLEDIDEDV